MKEIELKCWEDFEERVSTFFVDVRNLKVSKKPMTVSTPLFRGQADASWDLETTLDRVAKRDFGIKEYYDILRAVRPSVVSITGKNWEMEEPFVAQFVPLGYEFMVYLRHHGFPSPLLDWTRSPYVAAYFAFRSYERRDDGKVAIFSFLEWMGEAKSWTSTRPSIHGVGPYVVSHKRHYAQQCEYTLCTMIEGTEPLYTSHKAFVPEPGSAQDSLVKYTVPASERGKVFERLERMNVTAFSLFASEESLMETLSYQEIGKKILSLF